MALPDLPRWRCVSLAVSMFLITASVGFLQPFVPLYLEAAGLKRGHIGFVTGFGTGLALLIQPFLYQLRWKRHYLEILGHQWKSVRPRTSSVIVESVSHRAT